MDYVIHSMGMPFGPRTIKEASLGGSETAAYYLARELGKRGHRVSLWTTLDAPQETVDGVTFCWVGPSTQETPLGRNFEYYARNTPHDVLVIQRHPAAFHKPFAAKVCIWQLHDLALKRSQAVGFAGTWQCDAITGVSQWHVDQIAQVWDLPKSILFSVPNGVDPNLYNLAGHQPFISTRADKSVGRDEAGITLPAAKFIALYQSRPERGFEHLVRPGGIMDRIKHLPVHLVACGYENTTQQMAGYYDKLAQQAALLPNVTLVGALTKGQLAELQIKSDFLLYPTEFKEVSCITAMEAMQAGLPFVSSRAGALPETCAGSGSVLIDLKADGTCDEDAFVQWLENSFAAGVTNVYPLALKLLREQQRDAAPGKTWEQAVNVFESMVDDLFERRMGTHGAILRTAIERSDIMFAKWYMKRMSEAGELAKSDDIGPVFESAEEEIARLYQFIESPEAYQAHYLKHQTEYYDTHEELVIGEDVTQSTRFRGVAQMVMEHLSSNRLANPKVLDYGCAHGHYTMPLAKMLPKGEFIGLDISERAIEAFDKWAGKEAIENVQGIVGAQDFLNYPPCKFDVILAGEVLEHVADPIKLLNAMASALNPGGVIVASTPFGRWEHSGTEAFRTGREHLHHFDREDIYEICHAVGPVEVVCAPATQDRSGFAMGSWVWRVRPLASDTGPGFLWPNYDRRLKTYAPRQTISACLIVLDGERTLRKCVESFVDWVDEVRIFVDANTKDSTLAIAQKLLEDFPNRPFHIQIGEKVARKDGFDAARNESIGQADGDWILWCDADEEVYNAASMHRLVRPAAHEGYGFPQIHYSMDPPQVLTTDYPSRMFRNHVGIKFYGLVHEHPEKILGQAIPTGLARSDIAFLHAGYIDEATRRGRYQRNLPLVKKDLEAYPERKLNRFLWLRDLAQGMLWEQQQMGGNVAQHHIGLAEEGIKIYEKMVDDKMLPRMLSDAMPYYSHCVSVLGRGFESKINVELNSPVAPNLGVKMELTGMFHTRDFYKRLMAHILEESTKTYENEYL